MMTAVSKEKEKGANPMDAKMTPAQVARRKFKSTLPRKPEHRSLSPMQALGETFTLLDRFRSFVAEEMQDLEAAKMVYAALVFCLPKSKPETLSVPESDTKKSFGAFCEKVLSLNKPLFLGVVFVQVDLDAKKNEHRAVSFVVPFMSGPDAEDRLLFAQGEELTKIRKLHKILS